MDLSLSVGTSESFMIPFSLESTQFDECGRDWVYQPRPTLLSLFSSAPADKVSTKQMAEGESGRISRDLKLGGLALCLSTHHDSGYVEDDCLHQTSLRLERLSLQHTSGESLSTHHDSGYVQDESLYQTSLRLERLSLQHTSGAPSFDFIGLVPFQRTGCDLALPSEDPSELSPTANRQHFEADRGLIVTDRNSTERCSWTAISASREPNGPGSASSSRAAAQNSPLEIPTVTPSENPNGVNLDAQAAAGTLSNRGRRPGRPNPSGRAIPRHGPRLTSSDYKGVTRYQRTGRWEAHLWYRKQLYLGASSTEERAARAYDRAAIHFKGSRTELNFPIHDYESELRQLAVVSHEKIVIILRKQSAGEGTPYPDYHL